MDFEFSEEERAFRKEAADYIRKIGSKPGVAYKATFNTGYADTPARKQFMKDLGKGGYLGLSWPTEYGGKGLSPVYDFLLTEELAYQGMPGSGKGVGIIGRTLLRRGSEELKAEFLPRILNAEIDFAIGYSEPDAGSDLAALKVKAVRDGDGWRLNGQKRFSTSAHFAEWYFLLARTHPDRPKHKGITLFLIDLKSPGIQVNPMFTIDGHRTNEVFLDDVWVPDSQVIGEPGQGFYYVVEALDFERHMLFPNGPLQRLWEIFIDWVRTATIDGEPVRDKPEVRRLVGKLARGLEVGRLHGLSVVAARDSNAGTLGSSMNKIANSEFGRALTDAALDMMGPGSWLSEDDPGAPAEGLFERGRRAVVISIIGAGTNEIQRNIIARRGLGLPV
jgi:alkylation response protein AidB-like acyl-CoA dehydrogenase